MLNLDTHILLHALTGTLKPREAKAPRAIAGVSRRSGLWEVAKLAQLGRVVIDLDDPDVVRALARVHVWPLTREIALLQHPSGYSWRPG